MSDLSQVLADALGDAAVLRRSGHVPQADTIERLVAEVRRAAEDFLTFVAERDAKLASGRSVEWLRCKFREWEPQGHAKMIDGVRYYRLIILPRRANLVEARQAGRRGGVQ